jgi:Tfp pilus assembly protein PilF
MRKFRGFVPFIALACLGLSYLATTGCATSDKNQEKAQLQLEIGTKHLMKGQYPQAMAALLEAEKLDPDNAVVQNNLGLAYYVRHEYVSAEKHILKALQLSPVYTDARNNLGRVYIDLARYDLAIKELLQVTKDLTYSTPEKGFVNLGLAYLKKNEVNNALMAFRRSIENNNRFCPAHNYYGQALFQQQKYNDAIESFEKALKLCDNNYDEAHYYGALSYYKVGQREKARARFQEVVRLYPDSEFATRARSMLKIIQ